MSPRNRHEPASLVLYEDPLSPWCLVAERRILAAAEDVPGAFRALRLEPFPTRVTPRALSKTDRCALARAARRAAREPELSGSIPDLWLSPDPPLSSLPVLTALSAARLQGRGAEAALREAIRAAALFRGVNVARTDVLLELAHVARLDVTSFAAALAAPATEARVHETLRQALERGVREVPALVIGEEWLVVGARRTDVYRSILRRYVSERLGMATVRTFH
ncbi:MAG TPA: DsbA family protein [Anaeromyxobacter sp.]|nr:DsbA family protein [Anaeromyxobacter sp.]